MPDNDELLTNEPDDENIGNSEENEEEPVVLRDGGNGENNEEEEEVMADPTPTPLGKLKRSALMHYLDTNFDITPAQGTDPVWYLIGKDVEDMSVELNPETETKKNILDETSVTDKGYEPSFSVDTYYATPTDGAFYDKIKDIAMNRKTDDDCKTFCLEVLVDQADQTNFSAWMEEVIVKPTSYGGPQGGVSIPYTVTFTGNRVAGTVSFTNKVPTFTAAS